MPFKASITLAGDSFDVDGDIQPETFLTALHDWITVHPSGTHRAAHQITDQAARIDLAATAIGHTADQVGGLAPETPAS